MKLVIMWLLVGYWFVVYGYYLISGYVWLGCGWICVVDVLIDGGCIWCFVWFVGDVCDCVLMCFEVDWVWCGELVDL